MSQVKKKSKAKRKPVRPKSFPALYGGGSVGNHSSWCNHNINRYGGGGDTGSVPVPIPMQYYPYVGGGYANLSSYHHPMTQQNFAPKPKPRYYYIPSKNYTAPQYHPMRNAGNTYNHPYQPPYYTTPNYHMRIAGNTYNQPCQYQMKGPGPRVQFSTYQRHYFSRPRIGGVETPLQWQDVLELPQQPTTTSDNVIELPQQLTVAQQLDKKRYDHNHEIDVRSDPHGVGMVITKVLMTPIVLPFLPFLATEAAIYHTVDRHIYVRNTGQYTIAIRVYEVITKKVFCGNSTDCVVKVVWNKDELSIVGAKNTFIVIIPPGMTHDLKYERRKVIFDRYRGYRLFWVPNIKTPDGKDGQLYADFIRGGLPYQLYADFLRGAVPTPADVNRRCLPLPDNGAQIDIDSGK
jgi:hypothetical protein